MQRLLRDLDEDTYATLSEGQRALEKDCSALADVLRAADIVMHVPDPGAAPSGSDRRRHAAAAAAEAHTAAPDEPRSVPFKVRAARMPLFCASGLA